MAKSKRKPHQKPAPIAPMQTALYPKLGTKARFIRHNSKGQLVEGTCAVVSVHLAEDRRVMCRVEDMNPKAADNEKVFNLHIAALDPTPVFKKDFVKCTESVNKKVTDWQKFQADNVTRINAEIKEFEDKVFGAPVTLE